MDAMTFKRSATLCALALLFSVVLSGCGGSGSSNGAVPQPELPAVVTGSLLPAIPADRSAAGLTEQLIQGKAAELKSDGAVENGTALELASTISSHEFALYRINTGANAPDSISVLLDEALTDGAYLALANYATGRWQLSGPYSEQKTLLVDEPHYVSPLGNIWLAVLTVQGQSARINALSVRAISPANEAPLAALEADPLGGDAPLNINFDASASSDPDGQIIEYAWDFDGDGLYDGFSDEPLVSRLYSAPGLYNVKLRVTDEQFARATATLQVNVGFAGNISPQVSLQASSNSGTVPHAILFDANGTHDPDGYITKYEWDFDGNGIFDAYGSQHQLEHLYTSSHDGGVRMVLRVTDNVGAQTEASVNISLNEPPVALISAQSSECQPGEYIFFSAAGSHDPDGNVANYKWDTQGDGFYETDTGTTPGINFLFNSPGKYDFGLQVTDNLGGTATAVVSVTVRGWVEFMVDATTNGNSPSLALINGKPAFAFQKNGLNLAYARASTDLGNSASDWEVVTIDSSGLTGSTPSLAQVSGRPAISYSLNIDSNLRYAIAANASGLGADAGWTMITVDSTLNTGYHSSLAVVAGNPAICYSKISIPQALRYVRATSATGSTPAQWSSPVTVDAIDIRPGSCLAVINGKPAISYTAASTDYLRYARSSTNIGTNAADWTKLNIDMTIVGGFKTSLLQVAGFPAIAYYDRTTTNVFYSRCTDGEGTTAANWSQRVTLPTIGGSNADPSLCIVDNRPMIAHYQSDLKALRWRESQSAIGTNASDWGIGGIADNSSEAGFYPSACNIHGQLAVAYRNSEENCINYAILF